ncbi:Fic family protein [Aerococcaceae bacterium NML191292]|nr:Fic family protein [Aerococcaceae bacterium NML191292]MCW6675467.1 Fic family protein [Aerococcaceae bacterium NML171108]
MTNSIVKFILENNDYFEDFITRATYHSNAIEGSTLSYAETYAILFNDNSLTITSTARELYEAINHKYALNYVLRHIDTELDEKFIKEIARIINRNIQEISGYRTQSVIIRGAEHLPPPPHEVPTRMMYYVYNYHHTHYNTIFEKIAEQHILFEQIHPFADGNGRTGRLIMNFELIKNELPPLVIEKEFRTKYFEFLSKADVKGLADFIQVTVEKEQQRIHYFKQRSIELERD